MNSNNRKYRNLAEPIYIGKVRLKNRIIKNGTGFFWDNPDTGGFMNDKYLAYFETLARGGVALASTATGPLTTDPGAKMPGFKVSSDEYIPGWKKWADTVHKYDCLAFHQLFHLGPMTPLFITAPAGISASSIPRELSPRPGFTVPKEATDKEIQDIIELFASAAERMKKAGFDGTEVNGACNHFLNNFLSRAWNKRQDKYGCQTMENRTRVYASVIKEIKRRNGKDWPVIALMNGLEVDLEDGITIEESKQFAKIFEEAGADAIEIRAEYYTWVKDWKRRQSLHFPDVYFYPEHEGPLDEYVYGGGHGEGANIPMTAEIKKAVNIPVICIGKIGLDTGEKAIRRGKIDIVSMNRKLFADPELPKKVFEGRMDDINPCTSCMTCFNLGEHFQPIGCRVNASFGREKEYEISPAKKKKRVMIIGGGPSGMEAARVAALRGHEVLLYDKECRPGGSLPVASFIKGFEREELPELVKYLRRQIKKLGVKVVPCKEITPEMAQKVNPDVILLAAGGTHDIPDVPGIENGNVLTGEILHRKLKFFLKFMSPKILRSLSAIWLPFVGRNVVIMGGRLHGCQTAEFLVKRGRRVTIVDTGTREDIGEGMIEVFLKPYLLYWLEDKGVEIITEAKYNKITESGLAITTKEGGTRTIKADTIITALPLKPNAVLAESLKGMAGEIYSIGDAREPGLIIDAIAAGSKKAREL